MSELFNAQVKMYEIGIAQRIAHNMTKYKLGYSKAYTVPAFIRECNETLTELGISPEQRERIMKRAIDLVHQDAMAVKDSKLLELDGASECTPYAMLAGPALKLVEIQKPKTN